MKIFIFGALCFLFCGCSMEEGGNNFVMDGQIYNIVRPDKCIEVSVGCDDNDYVFEKVNFDGSFLFNIRCGEDYHKINAGRIENGIMSLNLPDITSLPNNCFETSQQLVGGKASVPDAMIIFLDDRNDFRVNQGGTKDCAEILPLLLRGNVGNKLSFMYSSKQVRISGVNEGNTFDINAKAGWNTLYLHVVIDGDKETAVISSNSSVMDFAPIWRGYINCE